jgi:hypothetical protein
MAIAAVRFDESPFSLVPDDETFPFEAIHGLAHGHARHAEFPLQSAERGNFAAGCKIAAVNALSHRGCQLQIKWHTTFAIGRRKD